MNVFCLIVTEELVDGDKFISKIGGGLKSDPFFRTPQNKNTQLRYGWIMGINR